MKRSPVVPEVLVLAGLEPLGRAGLLVDLEAVRANGGSAIGVATCGTAQDGARALIEPASARLLKRQLSIAFARRSVGAVKSGLIPTRRLLETLAAAVPTNVPWVLDPVVRASSGARLSTVTRAELLAVARPSMFLTPNLAELAELSREDVTRVDDRIAAARELIAAGFGAVVVKGGGHSPDDALDLVVTAETVHRLPGTRLKRSPDLRGTGCRFASALATSLAAGDDLHTAAKRAKAFVRHQLKKGLEKGDRLL